MVIRKPHRAGFTLLEVILASTISVVLLAALYIALDLQVRMAQTGREEVEKATISRAIFARITRDFVPSTAPIGPVKASSSSSSSSTSSSSTSSTSSSSSTSSTTTTAADQNGTPIPIQAGVVGDSQSLTIYTNRVVGPNDVLDQSAATDGAGQPCDQRRICYWLGSSVGGLCREEEKFLTTDTLVASTTPDYSNEPTYVIAPEVTQIQFEYFDGTSWNDSWDGTELAADSLTPLGPPLAIRVHLWIQLPNGGDPVEKVKSIALPTGPAPMVVVAAPGSTSSTSSTSSTTSP